ncbi:MAG: Ser-Thr-rich GPI-anchored membrane family protein [bacterium]
MVVGLLSPVQAAFGATITVTYPNGGEVLHKGNDYTITWTSSGVTGTVAIDLYKGSTNVLRLAGAAQNTGSYPFNPPFSLTNGSDYRIALSAMSGTVYDFSNAYFTIDSPTITLTSPNGGEVWDVGSTHTITWTSQNVVGTVLIQPYLNGQPQTVLTTNAPNTGSYTWTNISGTPSTHYTIGISAMAGQVSDFSNSSFTIEPLVPTVTVPNGGEAWAVGTTQRIQWTNPGGYTSVSLDVSRDGGSTWSLVESGLGGDYYYRDWVVTAPASANCRIRVTGYYDGGSRSDASNASFTITVPTITVTYPNGGEVLHKGNDYTITWTSSGVTGTVAIDLYKGSTNVLRLAGAAQNTGSYPFNPPFSLTNGSDYRIALSAMSGTVYDFSNAYFTIDSPTITLTSPNGGEVWDLGSTHTITWTSQNVVGTVLIQPYLNGQPQTALTTNAPNTGSYTWTDISGTPSTHYTIGISAMAGQVSDFSNSSFTIEPLVPTVTVPNGGEAWAVGTTQRVQWTNPGGYTSVSLDISRDGGSTWSLIETGLGGDFYYRDWVVTAPASGNCRIRVTGYYDGSSRSDASNSVFTVIPAPAVLIVSSAVVVSPTRAAPAVIYALPPSSDYGGSPPFESEKNAAGQFRIQNTGGSSTTLDDWGLLVSGGPLTAFRLTMGSPLTLGPGGESPLFDKRLYIQDDRLTGGSATSYTAIVQVYQAGVWSDVGGSGSSTSFVVQPRPALQNTMLVKRPRAEGSSDPDDAIIYYYQNGIKWAGNALGLNGLYPSWATTFYVYPVTTVSALRAPTPPQHDATIPTVTGRNLLYQSGVDVFIVEPEPGTGGPFVSRLFLNELAFFSYGYTQQVLNEEPLHPGSTQLAWIRSEYPVGSTIGGLTLVSPPNGAIVNSPSAVFSWTDVSADGYQLWVDDDPDFSSPEVSPWQLQPMLADSLLHVTSFTWGDGWFSPGQYYWKVRAYKGGTYEDTGVWSFTYSPPVEPAPVWGPLYRLYKNADHDHFYCTSENFQLIAISQGYSPEGVEGFLSLRRFASSEMVEVFRLYSDSLRSHFYTTSRAQAESLIVARLRYEGITGYAYGTPQQGLTPLYHLERDTTGTAHDNLYTTSEIEREQAQSRYRFTYKGITTYVSPMGDLTGVLGHAQSGLLGLGVSAGTGNFQHYTKASFDIPGIGLPLSFGHTYNSNGVHLVSQLRPLGPGWTHTYNACVVSVPDEWLVLWPDGAVHRYSQSNGQCLDRDLGVYDHLETYPGGKFEITKKEQVVYTFERPATAPVDYPSVLTSIHDRNGNAVTCTYEPSGLRRLTQVTGTGARTLSFTYDTTSYREYRLKSVTDNSGGRTVSFAYADTSDDLASYTDCAGHVTRYHYAADSRLGGLDHQLARIVLPKGNEIDNLYDNRKITSQRWTGNLGGVTLGYQDAEHVSVRNAVGNQALLTFDPRSRLLTAEDAFGAAHVSRTDPLNPAMPTTVQDRNGHQTSYTYDGMGNVRTVDRPDGAHWAYDYDSRNNVVKVTDPLNHQTVYGYNGSGNLTSVTDPLSRTTTYARQSNGLVQSVTNPLGHPVSFAWDSFGDLMGVQDNLGHTTTYVYDAMGRVTQSVDAEGDVNTYSYDCQGRISTETDPERGLTSNTHDANGNRTVVTDALGHPTTWGYNDLDLLYSITDAIGDLTTFTYYDDGSLHTRTRPPGTTSYTYDGAGRLSTISSTGATLTRDSNGNITGISDANGSETFTYNPLNRLASSLDYYGMTVFYSYDAAGNLQTLTYPGGKDVSYTYYPDNQLRTVRDWNGAVTSYFYRDDGSPDHVIYPNGVTTSFGYDEADRLTSLVHRRGDASVIAQYAYTLSALGHIASEVRTEPLSMPALAALNYVGTYDAANRLQSCGPTSYVFDGSGNMTSRAGPEPLTCSWDLENRLRTASGISSATYVYDTFGNRVGATRSGVVRRYVLDLHGAMSQVLMEADATGTPIHYYVYGVGLISRVDPGGTTRYYHWNNVGSVVAVTDETGAVTHRYAYDPFGKVLAAQEADANPFRFVGRWGVMDEGNGLCFMRTRYYDVTTGRFVAQDPVWSTNLYAYAGSAPEVFYDASGLRRKWWGNAWDVVESLGSVVTATSRFNELYGGFEGGPDFASAIWRAGVGDVSASIEAVSTPIEAVETGCFVWRAARWSVNTFIGSIKGVAGGYYYEPEDPMEILRSAPVAGTAIKLWDLEHAAWTSMKALW